MPFAAPPSSVATSLKPSLAVCGIYVSARARVQNTARTHGIAELLRGLLVHPEAVLERDGAGNDGLERRLERVNEVDARRGKVGGAA